MIKIHLRELLWEKDKTATALCEVTGLSRPNISRIVKGKHININLDTVDRICNFLECKITDLIEYTPD